MKKKWKIFWVTCAASGIIGVVFLLVSFAMGVTFQKIESMMPAGISLGVHEEVKPAERHADIPGNTYDGITALDIDLKAGELEILTSYSDYVEIQTESVSKKLKLNYYRKGNTLVVDSTDNLSGIVNQNLGTVCIYLPEELFLDNVKIDVGAGSLYIEDICTKDFSVNIGAGEAEIYSFTAKEADFNCGAGEIVARGNVDEEIDIDCGLGSVSYYTADSEDNYNYTLSCGVGEITYGANHYSGIGSEQKIDHHHAFKDMDIDCGLGIVEIIFEGGH